MTRNILFMTNFYLPKLLANGACIHQLVLGLKEFDVNVHVVSFKMRMQIDGEVIDGINIHRVKPRFFYLLRTWGENRSGTILGGLVYQTALLLNKIKKLFYLPFYPITSPLFIYRYFKFVEELHIKNKFDIVISSYAPIEPAICGYLLKNKYKKIKWGLYLLDSLSNGVKVPYIPKKLIEQMGWKWERILFRNSDKVFNMKCHERHFEKKRYSPFWSKMEIVDIPLLRSLPIGNNKSINENRNKYINLVYTGALMKNLRNPEYLCKSISKINRFSSIKLNFYSRGDCEGMLKEFEKQTGCGIISHGYVDMNKSIEAINDADILISIGNNNSDMIPSKIFEYMSTGKKIIHFYTSDGDTSLSYLKKYPSSLLIDERGDFDDNCEKINLFISEERELLNFEAVSSIFTQNKPSYTVNKILRMLER